MGCREKSTKAIVSSRCALAFDSLVYGESCIERPTKEHRQPLKLTNLFDGTTRRSTVFWVSLLTIGVLLVHGFHPAAEDGGIYTAGIYLRLHPTLFPHDAAFVRAPMEYSAFAWTLAGVVTVLRASPALAILLAHLFTVALTLLATRRLSRIAGYDSAEQLCAMGLLAAWWTLPVAGTSLSIGDPYLTARSFSMLLSLFAISFALEEWRDAGRRWIWRPAAMSVGCLVLAAAMHRLMFAFAATFVVLLRTGLSKRGRLAMGIAGVSFVAIGLVLFLLPRQESGVYLQAELTRQYWFLSEWHWYELVGLLAPLIIFCVGAWRDRHPRARSLFVAGIVAGLISLLVALLFAREGAANHFVARLQPLRVFMLLYVLMTIEIGAFLMRSSRRFAGLTGTATPGRSAVVLPALTVTIVAASMLSFQLKAFGSSNHIEMPWMNVNKDNAWVAAFRWCRENTPTDALFAIDAAYIHQPGEDAQTFRSTAWRSILPDQSKDGGEAAVDPALAERWITGFRAQTDLNTVSDEKRKACLQPLGVSWLILTSSAQTGLACSYNNETVKVCRLPAGP